MGKGGDGGGDEKSETKEAKPCFIRFAALPFIQS
jgi:hypothetical protein